MSMGSSELMGCAAFAFHIRLSLSQPLSFLAFILLILSPVPMGGSDQEAVWGIDAY